jgi:hypothetical protein
LFYYISIKLFTATLVTALFGPGVIRTATGAYEVAIASSLAARLPVLEQLLASTSTVWFAGFISEHAAVVAWGVLLIALSCVGLARGDRQFLSRQTRRLLERTTAFLFLFGISAAPVIVSTGGLVSLRSTFPTAAIIAVCGAAGVVRACGHRLKLAHWILSAFCLIAAVAASVRVTSAAYNANQELQFVRQQVSTFDKSVTKVILLQPPYADTIVDLPLYAEFGGMATNYILYDGIVRLAMDERGLSGYGAHVESVAWKDRDAGLPTEGNSPDTRVIDMVDAGFRKAARRPDSGSTQLPKVSAFPSHGCCGPGLAFDNNPHTFFESDAGFPVNLVIRNNSQCLTGYELASHSLNARMPAAWQFFGRDNAASDWRLLDARDSVTGWSDFERRSFQLPQLACFGEYEFRFLKSRDPALLRIAEITMVSSGLESSRLAPSPNRGTARPTLSENLASSIAGSFAVASNHQPGFEVANLNDSTLSAWGSAEGTEDTYVGIELPKSHAVRTIRIIAFSPGGRAHLRDLSIVAMNLTKSGKPDWQIVRARLSGGGPFSDKVTVPMVDDEAVITIEVDPRDPKGGPHSVWALACLSRSRGYNRNYLTAGTGVYLREIQMQ